MAYKLSICIATVNGREHFVNPLLSEFQRQIQNNMLLNEIQLVVNKDNKELSIGAKRQQMLESAQGEYVVNFDDDDWPFDFYLSEIMEGIKKGVDCIGFLIHMTTNGLRPQTCCHSLKYKEWANKVDGYDYVRNVTHFNPVKRSLALIAGYPDLRFGEDKVYSDIVTHLCRTEHFIDKRLFHYRYVNKMQFNQKYGIK